MRLRLAITTTLAATALAVVSAGSAQAAPPTNCRAAPGTSALDQYCETIPSAGGDQGTRGKHRRKATVRENISRRTRRALSHSGAAGRGILNLPAGVSATKASGSQTGGVTAVGGGSQGSGAQGGGASGGNWGAGPAGQTASGAQGGGTTGSVPKAKSSNPLDAVFSAASSGTSAGAGFVWILIVLALVMSALAWRRYRRSTGS